MEKPENMLCKEPQQVFCHVREKKREPCVMTVTKNNEHNETDYYPIKQQRQQQPGAEKFATTTTNKSEKNAPHHTSAPPTAAVIPPETRDSTAISCGLPPRVPRRKKKKKRRNVRFASIEADVVAIVRPRDDLTADDIRDLWWTNTEFNGIRLGAKYLTKDVRSHDKPLVAAIEEAYARALHLACSLSDQDFEDLITNCTGQAVCLQPWCERSLSARGLERYISRKHRYDRTEYAMETRAAVLRLAKNNSVSQDELSVFYQEYSRSALLYARFCGEADQSAANSPDSQSSSRRRSRSFSESTTTAVTCSCSSGSGSSAAPSSDAGSSAADASVATAASSPDSTLSSSVPVALEGRRDILRKSQEHSRGRLLVQELSQRRLEATTAV